MLMLSKSLIAYFFLITCAFTLLRCNSFDECEDAASRWKAEAPQALKDLSEVKKEIESNDSLREQISTKTLFLSDNKVENLEKKYGISMPKAKDWFNKYSGYISFQEQRIQVAFRNCYNSGATYSGQLIYSLDGTVTEYKSMVQVKDSTFLGNGWHYNYTKCRGCDN